MRQHCELISEDDWAIDGLGQQASIPKRIDRATEIILVDMPIWIHFWLAAERQIAWATGTLDHSPGSVAQMPSTERLFQTIWDVDQTWMPNVRALCARAEVEGKIVSRLASVHDLDALHRPSDCPQWVETCRSFAPV
jgi:hypothetical protein